MFIDEIFVQGQETMLRVKIAKVKSILDLQREDISITQREKNQICSVHLYTMDVKINDKLDGQHQGIQGDNYSFSEE